VTVPTLTVRYFAAAKAATGIDTETVGAATVADAVAAICARHGDRLSRVMTACSLLLDGHAVHDRALALRDDAELDVLPPFAGG
jgi:molybdopterin synthase sulfur carrier subunit